MKNLQTIPGIGKSISEDLQNIGYYQASDFCGEDPEKLKWWYWKDHEYQSKGKSHD